MKFTSTIATAAVVGSAMAGNEERLFSILRFTNKGLSKCRIDPIVSPGQPSTHVHTIFGGDGISMTSTGQDLLKSSCTNAQVTGDNSNYWVPSLFFQDPQTKKLESVEVYYTNIYYFFEKTKDEIKAFPPGLSMLVGNPTLRTPPSSGVPNTNPGAGNVQPISFTCPRLDNNYVPPNWPADSDGILAGMGNPNNLGEGVGFPDQNCNGLYSPLRADIHFPSCYKPDVGLTDYKNNMAWPTIDSDGYQNCAEGEIHVPHMFYEVYWDTPQFASRWTPGEKNQPFVFANGDATGYSSHADFMAGWDTSVLQGIIDSKCNTKWDGMQKCPGVVENKKDCTAKCPVDEDVVGPFMELPGNNPITGWQHGGGDANSTEPASSSVAVSSSPASSSAASSKAASTALPEATEEVSNVLNPVKPESTSASASASASVVAAVSTTAPAAASTTAQGADSTAPSSKLATCKPKTCNAVKTVYETVTVTASPSDAPVRRAHLHQHHARRGSHQH